MHIDQTTHEHGITAKVYTYEADFEVDGDVIVWKATVKEGVGEPRSLDGRMAVHSLGLAPLHEQAVRDDIVKSIDRVGEPH